MSDKQKLEKIWTVEQSPLNSWGGYDQHETFKEAEDEARRRAFTQGKDFFVMTPVARAKAPLSVNEVQVEKVT